MNFIDYCIATKNYSALSAANEYSKMFASYPSLPAAQAVQKGGATYDNPVYFRHPSLGFDPKSTRRSLSSLERVAKELGTYDNTMKNTDYEKFDKAVSRMAKRKDADTNKNYQLTPEARDEIAKQYREFRKGDKYNKPTRDKIIDAMNKYPNSSKAVADIKNDYNHRQLPIIRENVIANMRNKGREPYFK